MRKFRATCGIGFPGAEYEEEFEFDDTWTESDIEDEIWNWAEQYLDVNWEEVNEEED